VEGRSLGSDCCGDCDNLNNLKLSVINQPLRELSRPGTYLIPIMIILEEEYKAS
jgi:hypothetical protein